MISETGEMVGVMTPEAALEMARGQGMDLIEVSPKAMPPVVKILSFDKYRYQMGKAERAQKKRQKRIEVKGIRLSMRIGEHDMKFKAGQADKFLARGDKVKVEMFLRGRERANQDFAFQVIRKFLQTVSTPYAVEQEAKKLGNLITTVIAKKK